MIEYTNSQISELIDEHIHSDRNRQVLKSRYIDGLTYEALSEKYDLSVTQIRNIIHKSELILFKYLKST